MKEFLAGFVTAFAFRASPLECLGFALFCLLPSLLARTKFLKFLSHEVVFWICVFVVSFYLKDLGDHSRLMAIPYFLPDSWGEPLFLRWRTITLGAIFHLLVDFVSGHGITFLLKPKTLGKGNPWDTLPSLFYIFTVAFFASAMNQFLPLVLLIGKTEIVLGYGVVFPPIFLGTFWLWTKLAGRREPKAFDGKIVLDIRELAKNWVPELAESTADAGSDYSASEIAFEAASAPETTNEPATSDVEEYDHEDEPFSNEWVEKIRKEFFEPYRDLWEESGLTEVLTKALRMLDAEGDAPSVAGDTYDNPEVRSQYDLLTRISLARHTYDVVRLAVQRLKRDLPEAWQRVLPKLVVACVFHDMGKLPSIRKQSYVTGKHPIDGANLADLLLREAEHPWREVIADLVRRHHEKPGENASLEHKILVWADREARLEETTALAKEVQKNSTKEERTTPIPTVIVPKETVKKGKPETRPIPADFPLSEIFQKILERTNKLFKSRFWVAFSQPDGVVYVYSETLHQAISDTAKEIGYDDPFYHSTEESTKKSCLQSFYDEFRKRGWVPEKLVNKDYYGNFFRLWNPLKSGFTCTFYVPIKVSAFDVPLGKLERIRKEDPILSQIKIFGVAPPCELRGKCNGKCPFGR